MPSSQLIAIHYIQCRPKAKKNKRKTHTKKTSYCSCVVRTRNTHTHLFIVCTHASIPQHFNTQPLLLHECARIRDQMAWHNFLNITSRDNLCRRLVQFALSAAARLTALLSCNSFESSQFPVDFCVPSQSVPSQ